MAEKTSPIFKEGVVDVGLQLWISQLSRKQDPRFRICHEEIIRKLTERIFLQNDALNPADRWVWERQDGGGAGVLRKVKVKERERHQRSACHMWDLMDPGPKLHLKEEKEKGNQRGRRCWGPGEMNTFCIFNHRSMSASLPDCHTLVGYGEGS